MINATEVKKLRDRTHAGYMACKEALENSNGDFEKAIEYLRIKGFIKAADLSSRNVENGIVCSYISPDDTFGVLVEVKCETDFVARNNDFRNFVKYIAESIAAKVDNEDYLVIFKDLLNENINKFGENITIGRVVKFKLGG